MNRKQAIILIHDDEQSIVEMLVDLCDLLGYRVAGTSDKITPGFLYMKGMPDLLLLDLMLAGNLNGIEFAQCLRNGGFEQGIIAMSGSDQMTEIATASGLFNEVLRKPIDISTFQAMIERNLP